MISTISINGLTMGDGTQFTLLAADGLASPRVDLSLYPNSGQHGAQIANAFWRERHISFEIGMRDATIASYALLREQIIQAFSLPSTGIAELQINTSDGKNLKVDVQLANPFQAPLEKGRLTSGIFRVELVSANPYLYSQTLDESTVSLAVAGGTPIPAIIPLSLTSSGGSVTLENNGNGRYKPVITITGPCDTPTIRNNTTGDQFTVDLELVDGDSLVIDCDAETVFLNVNDNELDSFTGDFIDIRPGNNVILFSASTYNAAALATIEWRQSWIGT